MSKTTFENIYDFLKHKEDSHESFTVEELSSAIQVKVSTGKTYLSKKLNGVCLEKVGPKYNVNIIGKFTKKQFIEHMSQKSTFLINAHKGLDEKLKDRSIDAFFLAVEIYNRVTQKSKIESFCILIINAWELILKACLVKEYGDSSIYYINNENRTFSVSDCVQKIYANPNNPIRKNLETLIELRDKSIHLLLPEVNYDISRLFQSCVINYVNFIAEKFDESLLGNISYGFIALMVDQKNVPNFEKIKEDYGPKTSEELKRFLEKFKKEETIVNDSRFAVSINYKLVLTKKTDESDIKLVSSDSSKQQGVIIEVPKDINTTHPLLRNALLNEINQSFADFSMRQITSYEIDAIIFKENIKKQTQSEYHYFIEKPPTHKYSTAFRDYIINKMKDDSNYLVRCVESYKHHMKKSRKTKF